MSGKLNMGVIGLGLIGGLHARIISELPHTELVAVADINEEAAKKTAQSYNCDFYTDYNELLARKDIDAVSICVPEEYHVAPAVEAAKTGKHILMEKPIAKTCKEAMEIKKAAEDAGVRLMVAHVLRFDPRYQQLYKSIEVGQIGEPVHLYLKRTNPAASAKRLKGRVSIFYFLGVHDVDLMLWYAGSKVKRVYAQKVSKVNADINSEDTIMAIFNFENGAIGCLELCWALPNNTALGIVTSAEVVGTKGAGYVEICDQGLTIYTENNVFYPDTLHWPEINGKICGNLRDEISHFAEATLKGTPYVVPTDSAIKAVEVIEACFKSIETGLPVDM
ncbi:gfo/Idh/MocA family oxidoreductase [Biomaibacter acetigenes]|uniref:Gfo/Idh/MocA family oxidoreductase n=1 Tax=Biomaibacter acetigenes TaxID=2316383 RepID=A0A3G2R1A0_9FIRM|nr:Gfo/Idh/MocA family oxidoreductase [Biomaibacter acetigenes]AYO29203.1 gfo/Idh/MocA family oxidoreductase [Biomaibacter acetigenes]